MPSNANCNLARGLHLPHEPAFSNTLKAKKVQVTDDSRPLRLNVAPNCQLLAFHQACMVAALGLGSCFFLRLRVLLHLRNSLGLQRRKPRMHFQVQKMHFQSLAHRLTVLTGLSLKQPNILCKHYGGALADLAFKLKACRTYNHTSTTSPYHTSTAPTPPHAFLNLLQPTHKHPSQLHPLLVWIREPIAKPWALITP